MSGDRLSRSVAFGRLRVMALLLAGLTGCTGLGEHAPTSAMLVLRGVSVIDGGGGPPSSGMDVVIDGDRIVGIHASDDRRHPRSARVLDLPGRYVMPGLVDAHAHVTILLPEQDAEGARRMVYRRDVSERVLRILLAHGVTTVRNPSAPSEAGVALRDDVASGLIPGPRILTSGEHLNDARMSPEQIRAEVRRQAAAGVDMIKVYAGLGPVQVAAAVEEAHRLGIPVVGHLQRTTWTDAARIGIDAITHGASWAPAYLPAEYQPRYRQSMLGRLDWLEWLDLDGPEMTATLDELVRRRIPVDPTLITYHTKFFGDDPRWTTHPGQALVPEIAALWRDGGTFVADWTPADFARARALWPRMQALVRRYHDAGVLLAAGSDLPNAWTIPGISIHEELELLVEAGIPPAEVLRIATRNGAEALGLLDEIGTLEVGKRADLLVLSGDPTVHIRSTRAIEAVIRGGEVLRPGELLGRSPADPAIGAAPLAPALSPVPFESVERGIGVLAFDEGDMGRADTLRILQRPGATSPIVAMVVGPASGYTLYAEPGVRRNAAEIGYEELALPFDSVGGRWARVVYGRSEAGEPLRGWVARGDPRVRAISWAELLQRFNVYLPDEETPRFHRSPGGPGLELDSLGVGGSDYDLQPLAVEGDWLQVRVTVPSICSGEPPVSQRLAWIRYLDPDGRPLVWARTRGC